MRKSPSSTSLPEVYNRYEIPADLIGISRSKLNYALETSLAGPLEEFEQCSCEYEENPSIEGLFRLAESSIPISIMTAILYCKMVLEKCPYHEGAKNLIKKLSEL